MLLGCCTQSTGANGFASAVPNHRRNIPKYILQNKKIFFQYDKPAIHQLYRMITNAKGSLVATILSEKQYKEKAERLLSYLQKEYHID